ACTMATSSMMRRCSSPLTRGSTHALLKSPNSTVTLLPRRADAAPRFDTARDATPCRPRGLYHPPDGAPTHLCRREHVLRRGVLIARVRRSSRGEERGDARLADTRLLDTDDDVVTRTCRQRRRHLRSRS